MRSLLLVFALLVGSLSARADLVVSSTADTDGNSCDAVCTLRQAINTANNTVGDDTITFAANVTGTIQLTSALPVLNTNITLTGPGATILTVSGEGAADPYRIFAVTGGAEVTLSDLTIANGYDAGVGGGLANNLGTVHLNDCTFIGNFSGDGGGLYNNGTATLQNCTFDQNTAAYYGAGIYNDGYNGNAHSTITNCTFTQNSSGGSGGAIFSNGSGDGTGTPVALVEVSGSTFRQNTARDNGGAIESIANSGSATLTVDTSTFDNNGSTNGSGGAIYNQANSANISTSTFLDNHADTGAAGALANAYNATLTLKNSTFSANHALGDASVGTGGAINNFGTLTVDSSTFSGNSANVRGGGIFSDANGTLNLSNSIVAGNTANTDGADISGTLATGDYNLVQQTSGVTLTGTHNIISVDPKLSTLQDNGGPTQTFALATNSPAFNKGNTTLATDQRGIVRPQGRFADIGAYEADSAYRIRGRAFKTFVDGTVYGIGDVIVTIHGTKSPDVIVMTDAQGFYDARGLLADTYTVTAARTDKTFNPNPQNVTLPTTGTQFSPNARLDFTTYLIFGTVTNRNGALIPGVSLELSGADSKSNTTDTQGFYRLPNLGAGTFTVTPVQSGFTFTPAFRTYTLPTTGKTHSPNAPANFVRTPVTPLLRAKSSRSQ